MRTRRRLYRICSRLTTVAVMLAGLAALPGAGDAPAGGAAPATRPAGTAAGSASPIPPDLRAALEGLKTADEAGRERTYALVGDKGDARLIPLLKAYRDGSLQLRDGRLTMYGERTAVPERGSVLPLLDALTGDAVGGDDGKPLYFAKPDLSKAIKAPPRSERGAINDLISALSLLDPDPDVRTHSIQDVGERASRAFISPDDTARLLADAAKASAALKARTGATPTESGILREVAAALDALPADRGADALSPSPTAAATAKAVAALAKVEDAVKAPTTVPTTAPAAAAGAPTDGAALLQVVTTTRATARTYQDGIEQQQKTREELAKYLGAVTKQLDKDPQGHFAPALRESKASLEAVLGDRPTRLDATARLGKIGTARAANLLRKITDAARRYGDADLEKTASAALHAADRYQGIIRYVQNTFAGLSLGSILVLLALGLSIIFGLMGVINMAHGEFMMVGAFTTYGVSEAFKHFAPGWFNWYPVAAVPAAFLAAGLVGLACEWLIIRHLYGRAVDTLLATLGVGLILIWAARGLFGDNLSVTPPKWMEGGVEVAPDLTFPLNRVYIIVFCSACIAAVYYIVNRTKLGLLLRATTQNRDMAAALGVPTRWVDALTFAFGAGLAGLAGVVVPLYNKINPSIGQEYIVDSFMVVVVGGVGKLAGAILAGVGMGFVGKYLEALLGSIPSMASGSSVVGRVLLLAAIVLFLQWRPSGLFPPKGRMADA